MGTRHMPTIQQDKLGKIITFYSYKGGTGRTMALANVAWILASRGKRVLIIDWDLEAPGLHRYFYPFIRDRNLSSSPGLIDFIVDYAVEAMTPESDSDSQDGENWQALQANILRYAFSIDWDFPGDGTLDFVPAGRQDASYATKVNSFNWFNFYEKLGGGSFIEAAKKRMQKEYDYILVDSRTGVSDTSGICTVQLPDVLVILFTFNNQSMEGASAVAHSAHTQRGNSSDMPKMRVFPVPCRVETAEKDRLSLRREIARERFDDLLWHIEVAERRSYWGKVETFYEPFYAYEEVLATFKDEPEVQQSLLASMERLTAFLSEGTVTRAEYPTISERRVVLKRYSKAALPKFDQPSDDYLFYVSYAASDRDSLLENLFCDLIDELKKFTGQRTTWGYLPEHEPSLRDDAERPEHEKALSKSRILLVLISPAYVNSQRCGKELSAFLARQRQKPGPSWILPILWIPLAAPLPDTLTELKGSLSKLSGSSSAEGLRHTMRRISLEPEYLQDLAKLTSAIVNARTNPIQGKLYYKDFESAFAQPSLQVVSSPMLPSPLTEQIEVTSKAEKPILLMQPTQKSEVAIPANKNNDLGTRLGKMVFYITCALGLWFFYWLAGIQCPC
jgi:hypothetical protein